MSNDGQTQIAKRRHGAKPPNGRGRHGPRPYVGRSEKQAILEMKLSGKSNLQIARAVGRNRNTISKVIHSDEAKQFLSEMRARFYGAVIEPAIAAVLAAVKDGDADLAYKVLSDVGVVPSERERYFEPMKDNDSMRTRLDDSKLNIDMQLAELMRIKHECYATTFEEIHSGQLLKASPIDTDDTVPEIESSEEV